jgi:c-di-AMP phosphodiesterase-like protein
MDLNNEFLHEFDFTYDEHRDYIMSTGEKIDINMRETKYLLELGIITMDENKKVKWNLKDPLTRYWDIEDMCRDEVLYCFEDMLHFYDPNDECEHMRLVSKNEY